MSSTQQILKIASSGHRILKGNIYFEWVIFLKIVVLLSSYFLLSD